MLALLGLLPGCATVSKMSPKKTESALDTSRQSVLLASLTIENRHHESFRPNPIVVMLQRNGGQQASDRLNYQFDNDAAIDSDSPARHYLIRIPIEPGRYQLVGINGAAGVFPIHGVFFLPLHYDIEVKPGAVEYLGHIDAAVVDRKDGELRAGPLLPLIDQAAAGFSGGTWTVTVSDSAPHDVEEFKAAFPALARTPIEDDALPPWDKAKETMRWQAN